MEGAVNTPKRPFAAIVGGSKVSSKISVIEAMLNKVDKLVLGGGMVFTFLKARGISVGKSLVEDDQLELAKSVTHRIHTHTVTYYYHFHMMMLGNLSSWRRRRTWSSSSLAMWWSQTG